MSIDPAVPPDRMSFERAPTRHSTIVNRHFTGDRRLRRVKACHPPCESMPRVFFNTLNTFGISLKRIVRGLLYGTARTGYNKLYEKGSANVQRLETSATTAKLVDRCRRAGDASYGRDRLGPEAGQSPRRRQRFAPVGHRGRARSRDLRVGVLKSQEIAPDVAGWWNWRGARGPCSRSVR